MPRATRRSAGTSIGVRIMAARRDALPAPRPSYMAKVSLTMIVRNEEQNLPRCLESVRGLFDEIVVVDTGSTDRTKEIAAGFGARVFDFAWIDDFAAARNVALDHATGDYAFWLDADDVIEPPERDKLKSLLDTVAPGQERRLCAALLLRYRSGRADRRRSPPPVPAAATASAGNAASMR